LIPVENERVGIVVDKVVDKFIDYFLDKPED